MSYSKFQSQSLMNTSFITLMTSADTQQIEDERRQNDQTSLFRSTYVRNSKGFSTPSSPSSPPDPNKEVRTTRIRILTFQPQNYGSTLPLDPAIIRSQHLNGLFSPNPPALGQCSSDSAMWRRLPPAFGSVRRRRGSHAVRLEPKSVVFAVHLCEDVFNGAR